MSRVWTKVVSRWNGERYVVDESLSEFHEYDGPVALCKGDQTAKQSEQVSLQNQEQQLGFSKQLMDIFQAQYSDQKDVLDYLKGKLQPMIENPQGYSDSALAAMRTSADDTISRNSDNAQQTLQSSRFANGSRDIPSGVDQQLDAALLDSESQQKSQAQNQITQANENLKQANYWNSVNALGGTGAQFNPQSYASGAEGASGASSGAGNATSEAANAFANSKKGFWSTLGGSLASTLGSTLGGGNANGGSGVGGFFGLG